jgi:nitrogenase subunit NifH
MAKIYRRSNLVSGTRKKKKVEKNRVRNIIMNFRVSPQEKELIDNRIRLSGLARGEFFIQSCTRQKIVTTGNIKTFDAIRESVKKIDGHLQEIRMAEELDEGILVELRTILELLDSIYNEEADNDE